jgi:hypothetical protein
MVMIWMKRYKNNPQWKDAGLGEGTSVKTLLCY